MSRILVVDDEAAIRKVVQDALESAGNEIETAANGAEAIALFESGTFDLVITDLNMPGLDGRALVRRVRAKSHVPVLILTVRNDEREKVELFDAGADDYVHKPFSTAELVARSKALLRRAGGRAWAGPVSSWGDIEIDRESRTVRRRNQPIHLTPTEYELLTALLARPGAVWTHRELMAEIWGTTTEVTSDTLRVHMGSLRRKLEPDSNRPRWIHTEPWVGYRFTPEE